MRVLPGVEHVGPDVDVGVGADLLDGGALALDEVAEDVRHVGVARDAQLACAAGAYLVHGEEPALGVQDGLDVRRALGHVVVQPAPAHADGMLVVRDGGGHVE